jgi:glycosyltransferase involved in cell wall biosynthesis
MNPEVSVVIAVYNGAKYISETLESILNQTYTNWECIVVDDGSTDDTCRIIENFISKDKRFKIIKTDGGNGPYIAANIGIKASDSKYIARTDADDILLPKRIETQVSLLEIDTSINIIGSFHYYLFENGEKRFKPFNTSLIFLKWQLIFRNRLVHSTMMFRKIWFLSIGLYPEEKLAQDWHIWLEGAYSDSLCIIEEPLIEWRLHNSSVTKTMNHEQLELGSNISANFICNRFQIDVKDAQLARFIIASIRGDKVVFNHDFRVLYQFLLFVFKKFKTDNKLNNEIRREFHYYLDLIFYLYANKSARSIYLYLSSITLCGITFNWIKGFVRLLKKYCFN